MIQNSFITRYKRDLGRRLHHERRKTMGKGQFDEDDEEETERLSVSDAAMIWRSNGEDEDYMFGYSERALRKALGE